MLERAGRGLSMKIDGDGGTMPGWAGGRDGQMATWLHGYMERRLIGSWIGYCSDALFHTPTSQPPAIDEWRTSTTRPAQ